jgi:hypothetical protein
MPAKKTETPPPQPTWDLRLTTPELLHLRDLVSVLLPPNGEKTVSQMLAEGEGRQFAETKLWKKLVELCRKAKLPLNDQAPDYVVMTVGAPTLAVIRIASEDGGEEPGPEAGVRDPSELFTHPGDDDDGGSPEPPRPPKKTPAKKSRGNKGKKP